MNKMTQEQYDKWMKEKVERDKESQNEYQKQREADRRAKVDGDPLGVLEKAGIPQKYWRASLTSCHLPKPIIEDTSKFLQGEYPGLFLTGIYGCGKTYLACALGIELLLNQYKGVVFCSVPQFLHQIRSSFNNTGVKSEKEIVDTLMYRDYVIMDDLGAEKVSDFSLDRLYLVIDYRYSNEKPTIITSNLDLNEIRDRIHDRLGSRIAEMCECLMLPEKDYRVILKNQKGGGK